MTKRKVGILHEEYSQGGFLFPAPFPSHPSDCLLLHSVFSWALVLLRGSMHSWLHPLSSPLSWCVGHVVASVLPYLTGST